MFFKQFYLQSLGHASYFIGLEETGEALVLDVRQPAEWSSGHIPQAQFITGAELPHKVGEVPRDRILAVICGSGYRSTVMASLLRNRGYQEVVTVMGGMKTWKQAGLNLEKA